MKWKAMRGMRALRGMIAIEGNDSMQWEAMIACNGRQSGISHILWNRIVIVKRG